MITVNRNRVSFCLSLALALFAAVTWAKDYQAGAIHILDPFSRALPPISENGAVYLTLINRGHQPDRLLGAAMPIAEHAEIHAHQLKDGMVQMRPVDSVELPPHEEVVFAPGGYHIMLIQLTQPLKEGQRFPLMLHFKEAGHASVEIAVKAIDATAASHQ